MARILVVDDSIVMRKNLQTILTEAGHEVVGQAINGKQAVIAYSELKPDLVTMDISMPIMSGVDAVNHIINKDPNAKIIMISALNQKQMVFEALNNGAKHYIIKPIEANMLLRVVTEVLAAASEEVSSEARVNIETKPGFNIENLNGTFTIFFNSNLGMKDHNELETAIKGLLFIKPLNIVFNFGSIEKLSDEIIIPIIRMANMIKKSGGIADFNSESKSLLARITEGGM